MITNSRVPQSKAKLAGRTVITTHVPVNMRSGGRERSRGRDEGSVQYFKLSGFASEVLLLPRTSYVDHFWQYLIIPYVYKGHDTQKGTAW